MADFIVPTDRGKVRITLGKVPTDLKERNRLIDQELKAGRFTAVTPGAGEVVAELGAGLAKTAAPLILPALAIGAGASRGAAIGAPMGPVGAGLGAVAGGMLGGWTGYAGNEAAESVMRYATGEPPKPFEQVMHNVFVEGGQAGALGGAFEAAAPPVAGFLAARQIAKQAQQRSVDAARAMGVELTAAEQAGTPMLRGLEALTARSFFGAGSIRDIGGRQTQQVIRAGTELGETLTGPMLEQAYRTNRFIDGLKARFGDLKKTAEGKFRDFTRAAGADSQVDVAPLVQAAAALEGDLPKLASLQNGRLKSIIDDIKGLGKDKEAVFAASPIVDEFGAPLQTLVSEGGPQITTLTELRRIRSALGDIAYPDRLGGVAVVDAPVGAARMLYGRLTGMLEAEATKRGPAVKALYDDANQFYRLNVANLDDNRMYAALLANEKQLGSFSKSLFNPRDTGMLLDAKRIVSDDGWRLVQQQYWDDVFSNPATGAIKGAPQDVEQMFLGKQFADRITKDGRVLDILFAPDQVKAIRELADVAKLAGPSMSVTRIRDFTTGAIGVFVQGGGAGAALSSMASQGVGPGNIATLGASTLGPYILGKALTNPTTARMIAGAAKAGTLDAKTGEAVVRYLGQTGAIMLNQPDAATELSAEDVR